MSIFNKDMSPNEALDVIAEAAYEEFQIRVPTEKISFYFPEQAKLELSVKSSRRIEILECESKEFENQSGFRHFLRDEVKLAVYGGRIERIYNNGIVGYELTVLTYKSGEDSDLERRYWLLDSLSHETGHAVDYELRRKIKPKVPELKAYAAANSELLKVSRELYNMLSKKEIRKFYTSPLSFEDIPNCAERNIRIASKQIKKSGNHKETARLEKIIQLSARIEECAETIKKPYEKLDRLGFENTKSAIHEGWAFYFQNWLMANLIKKEVKDEIPEISEMDAMPAMKYALDNIKSLKLKESSRHLIKTFNRYFIHYRNYPGAHGEGFRKFENLSKEEAQELVFNYYYNEYIKKRDKRLKKNALKISTP